MRDPADYDGELVCPCCGSGWPSCTDRRTDGTRYTHEESCARYRFGELCSSCAAEDC